MVRSVPLGRGITNRWTRAESACLLRQLVCNSVDRRRVNSTVIWLRILNRLAYHVGIVKVRDVLKLLRSAGWSLITTVGSHRQLKHPTKPGRVTVSGHPSDDIHPKTLKSILTQAGLKK